jgi:[ribosomal protein S18]-alanine N-acetyltransferase
MSGPRRGEDGPGGAGGPGGADPPTTDPSGPAAEGGLRIRPARGADLPDILGVESASFSTPWSAAAFQALLRRKQVAFLVLEEVGEGRVVGHGVLWWLDAEAEVANVAVAPEWRGRGGGGLLLDALLDRAREVGVSQVFLEVRASNRSADRLYRSRGFRQVGLRRDYYSRPREDARVLRLTLAPLGDPEP